VTSHTSFVRWFADLGLADVAEVGGKCASLGELLRAGLPVPPGFAVTTTAYARYRDGGTMPDEVRAAIAQAYTELAQHSGQADPPVAVRSSAIGEDSAEASFAGQQETYLWRRGIDDVATHVVRCWESLYSAEAVAYRAHLGETGATGHPVMSVGVQRMVDARVAGVLFTLSPTTGDRSVIAINASWGLGLGVVGGDVTPDEYWVDKVLLRIKRRTIVDKPREHRPDPDAAGTIEVAVPGERRHQPSLTDDEVLQLARLGRRIEQHYGAPQDVEWAIEGSEMAVLQSRPETVRTRRRRPVVGDFVGSATDYVVRSMLPTASR
jgi:pyruvate, water dikinase